MINNKELLALIGEQKPGPDSIEKLHRLIETYPYFHTARVLLLRSLLANEKETFDKELPLHAPLIPSRRHLYNILFPVETVTQPSPAQQTANPTTEEHKEPTDPDSAFELIDTETPTEAVTIDATPENRATPDTDILELIDSGAEPATGTTDSSQTNDLIDKLINSLSEIKRPEMPDRNAPVETEDISASSVAEPKELASETLAEIYIAQGYYEKAIEVYQKLGLKYPEKNSYFADQIQKIKKKLNS